MPLAIGDLNRDGVPDLVIANGNQVSVLINPGDARFRVRREYATGHSPASVAIGDLNGDGNPELVTANYPLKMVTVLLNKGGGRFGAKLDYYLAGGRAWGVAIGDLNGDGRQDVATANFWSTVAVLLNTPGLCTVQDVRGMQLTRARGTLLRANCRVGKVRVARSGAKRRIILSQEPKFGAVLPRGSKVNLVVSRG
jgi:FG-GAP-like repeat/PASTA domain/FG-GAP repeat